MHTLAVLPANYQDRDVIAVLLKMATARLPTLKRAMADGGYQGAATAAAVQAEAGIPLEIVKRSDTAKGFVLLPKRWIVERTFGWLGRCRRLAKDFENLTRTHAAFVILAMIRIMLRRLIRT
jgi:transposase